MWSIKLDWNDCPFIEWHDYTDNICKYKDNIYNHSNKSCNIENCPIKEVS